MDQLAADGRGGTSNLGTSFVSRRFCLDAAFYRSLRR
jgi:hypothetical protein